MTQNLSGGGPAPKYPGSEEKSEDRFRSRIKALRAASVGWNFVTAPLVGAGLGYGIDTLLGTYPWAMVVGIILGFISAFIEVMKLAR